MSFWWFYKEPSLNELLSIKPFQVFFSSLSYQEYITLSIQVTNFNRLSIEIMENARFQISYFFLIIMTLLLAWEFCVPLFCNLSSFLSRFQHYCIWAVCIFFFRQEGYCQPPPLTPTGCRAPVYVVHPKVTVGKCCRRNREGLNFLISHF